MRSIKTLGFVALLLTAFASIAFISTRVNKVTGSDNNGFAVVELFTSEGCSSCPPADELVAKIQKENNGKPVYILAFHVDYWNRLGWKDVFSNADYSKRQNDYANFLHLQSVYTPQIVVDGKTEFVGSEENTLRAAISSSLQKMPSAQLNLSILKTTKSDLSLKYDVAGDGKNSVLLLALIQKSAKTKVERGENEGHTLSHVQIVRKLQSIQLNESSGKTTITLPGNFDPASWEVIGLLQNTSNGSVTAAAKVSFMTEANLPAKNFRVGISKF
jgi:hypothetical protein